MYYIIEKVNRPTFYDRVYTPAEYRSERRARKDAGLSFFDTAVIKVDDEAARPDCVSVGDPRILHPRDAGPIRLRIKRGDL